jgi:hypothetical protein
VSIAAGVDAIPQYLSLGVIDEPEIALAPVLFGGDTPIREPLRGGVVLSD